MSPKQRFVVVLTLLILGRIFDMFTTYLYIPDLKGETNVLVRWFGLGWIPIILIHLTIIGALAYCLYYYCFKFQTIKPRDRTLTLKEYISYFHFNEPNRFAECFYKTPANKKAFFASLGYIVPMALICISFTVGISTSLLLISEKYKAFYKNGGVRMLFVLIAVYAIFFYVRFFKREYNKYKTR